MKTPVSISEIYYLSGKYGWIFQLVLACIAIVLLPIWVAVSEEHLQWLCFLACGGLLLVSVAPCFKLPLEGTVHYGAAIICCISAILWQILMNVWDVTLWFMAIAMMLSLQMKDKWCFWLECATMGSLFANLYRLLIN